MPLYTLKQGYILFSTKKIMIGSLGTIWNVTDSHVYGESAIDTNGHIQIRIDGVLYYPHRLIALSYCANQRFKQIVHHINGILKLMELGHTATVDELMEEKELLYKGMRELIVKSKVDEVFEVIEKRGLPFICWTSREKAELLQFQLDDNSYNMQLYNSVCRSCGIDTSDMDEVFEDYQAIYDKNVEMQGDKEVDRSEGGRDRVR